MGTASRGYKTMTILRQIYAVSGANLSTTL